MSAASIRLINSLPTDGALGLPVGTEINSLTPLGVGDLVLRPASPGDGPATETIEITTELVGVAFPGIGMTRLEAGTTAFPMLIVIASRGALPHQITLRSSVGGGGGSATAANQVLGLTALDSIYDALTLVGTEVTSTQILGVLTALKGTSTLDDLAAGLTAISGGASQADIKTALETQGVDIGLTLAAVNTLVTNTDGIETLLAAIQAGTDKIPLSPAQDRTTAAAPSATRASNGTAFIDIALDATAVAVKDAVDLVKNVLDTIKSAQTDGTQKGIVRGGAKGATTAGDVTSTAIDADTQALNVNLKGTNTVSVGTASALADNLSNPTIAGLAAYMVGWTGSVWERVKTLSGRLVVSGNVASGSAAALPVTTGGVDSNGYSYPFVGAQVGSAIHQFVRVTGDGSGVALASEATLTNGNQRTKVDGASPTSDASTGVYTRFPSLGTASVAFTAGVAAMKASGGRVRRIKINYTGTTGSGLFVQLHAAATETTPSNATFIDFWPIDSVSPTLEVDSSIDLPCQNGIKFAFSATPTTYTAATGESGSAIAWGA